MNNIAQESNTEKKDFFEEFFYFMYFFQIIKRSRSPVWFSVCDGIFPGVCIIIDQEYNYNTQSIILTDVLPFPLSYITVFLLQLNIF